MIAFQLRRVAVTLDCPGLNDLAAGLLDRVQLLKVAVDFKTCLLEKFPLGSFERLLAFSNFSLRNCPCAGILARPKRSARVNQKYLELIATAIQQQSGAV